MAIYFCAPLLALIYYELIKRAKIKIRDKDYTTSVYLILAFVVPFITFAFRDISIGIDTNIYCRDFRYIANYNFIDLIKNGYGEYERGFLIFCRLLSMFSRDPIILLIASSLLINWLFARVISKNNSFILISILTYFFLGNYLYNLNIMRQAIAAGIVLNGILVLNKKKYVNYAICVAIAATFHTFAVVSILFIPAVIFIKNKKQLVLTCLLLGVVIFSSLEIVHTIVLRYFVHFDYYFRNNFHADQQFGVTSFAYVALEASLLFLMLKNYDMDEENQAKLVTISIGLVLAAFGLIMMPRFGIYERIAKFYQPFLILAVPYAISGIKVKTNKYIYMLSFMLLSFIYFLYIIVTNAYRIVPFVFYSGI